MMKRKKKKKMKKNNKPNLNSNMIDKTHNVNYQSNLSEPSQSFFSVGVIIAVTPHIHQLNKYKENKWKTK